VASADSSRSDDENAIDSERDEDTMAAAEPMDPFDQKPRMRVHKYTAYDCFRDLVNCSPLFKVMSSYGGSIIPLSMAGMYFNYAGNHLLHHIYHTYDKKVFHHGHKVVGVQLLPSGDILTTAIKKQYLVKKKDNTGKITFI